MSMKASEVQKLTVEELQERLAATTAELTKLKMNHRISDLENPMVLRAKRRDIAKLKTALRAKEIETVK